MNQHLQTFLTSYKRCLPQKYSKLLQKLNQHPNLLIYHPILATGSTHPLNIRLQVSPSYEKIPRGVNIFMLSTSQAFSNFQLIGATVQDKVKVMEFFQKYQKEYEMLENQEMRGLFSLMIQIYANGIDSAFGEMPLNDLASLLLDQAYPTTPQNLLTQLGLDIPIPTYKKYIRSFHLQSILQANTPMLKKIYTLLSDNFIRTTTSEQEFINLLKLVRAQMREINQNSRILNNKGEKKVQVVAPLLASLRGSDQPNCVLVGKYFTHLRQSYFCLETLRPIQGGEQLTIPNRTKSSNYDKLLRSGYKQLIDNPNNPNNEYILIINLMDPSIEEVQEMMSASIDEKKICLSVNNLKMKNLIKINKNGQIIAQDLKMLRILFGVFQDLELEKERIQVDGKIYRFVDKFVEASLKAHLREEQKQTIPLEKGLQPKIIQSFRIIQKGQIQILNNFIKYNQETFKK